MARMDMAFVNQADIAAGGAAAETLFNLGMMYCIGREVEPDLVSAHKWFNLAALRGSEEARQYRLEISQEMSSEEIAEAQRQARNWMAMN